MRRVDTAICKVYHNRPSKREDCALLWHVVDSYYECCIFSVGHIVHTSTPDLNAIVGVETCSCLMWTSSCTLGTYRVISLPLYVSSYEFLNLLGKGSASCNDHKDVWPDNVYTLCVCSKHCNANTPFCNFHSETWKLGAQPSYVCSIVFGFSAYYHKLDKWHFYLF